MREYYTWFNFIRFSRFVYFVSGSSLLRIYDRPRRDIRVHVRVHHLYIINVYNIGISSLLSGLLHGAHFPLYNMYILYMYIIYRYLSNASASDDDSVLYITAAAAVQPDDWWSRCNFKIIAHSLFIRLRSLSNDLCTLRGRPVLLP